MKVFIKKAASGLVLMWIGFICVELFYAEYQSLALLPLFWGGMMWQACLTRWDEKSTQSES